MTAPSPDRDPLAMAMLAAWVNVRPDQIPPEYRPALNQWTMDAWKRVGEAAIAFHLASEQRAQEAFVSAQLDAGVDQFTEADEVAAAADPACWLILKGGYFYRPNAQGYTFSKAEAGRFSEAEAKSLTHPNGPDGPRDGLTYQHEHLVRPFSRTPAAPRGTGGPAISITLSDALGLIDALQGNAPEVRRVAVTALQGIIARRRAEVDAELKAAGPPQCLNSPNGRHQVDTSMESGPNNCFHCEAPMGRGK